MENVKQLGGIYRAKEEFSGDGAVVSYLNKKEIIMKLSTIALAIAFTLPSTFALARGGMSIVKWTPEIGPNVKV